jgi:dTDP-4-amino-4,6-dideoxygalactose transaminase
VSGFSPHTETVNSEPKVGISTTKDTASAAQLEAVPFQDLARENSDLAAELNAAVREVIATSRFVLGPAVERFERAIADLVGVRHAVGVNSGTDALFLALKALGIGSGDEVITSPFSFFSSGTAVIHTGATPVFADIDARTFNIDPAAVEAAITPRTVAIVPVHLYGQMADMYAIREIADRHGLAVVEDAAQAIGASLRAEAIGSDPESGAAGGRSELSGGKGSGLRDGQVSELRAGGSGTLGCFSFYPTKNLGAWGDAGLITTDDDELNARIRRLRVHGCDGRPYHAHELGFNSRLDALQAAVLHVKLSHLPEWNRSRREHAAAYDRGLARVTDIARPHRCERAVHTYHQYTIRCRNRDAVLVRLGEAGIGCAIYYPSPLHLQEPFADLGHASGAFREAERAAGEVLSLPIFAALREDERDRVIAALQG